jgi:hypothetical protein
MHTLVAVVRACQSKDPQIMSSPPVLLLHVHCCQADHRPDQINGSQKVRIYSNIIKINKCESNVLHGQQDQGIQNYELMI